MLLSAVSIQQTFWGNVDEIVKTLNITTYCT